jgi:hypothetical protein
MMRKNMEATSRVLVAGATGALGRPLVRRLVEHGVEVAGLTRHASKTQLIGDLGAEPVVADALDAAAIAAAVVAARPEAVVHALTAIPKGARCGPETWTAPTACGVKALPTSWPRPRWPERAGSLPNPWSSSMGSATMGSSR